MFLFWLLWIVVIGGGFYLGSGYAANAYRDRFELPAILNALIYLGCALYSVPKFLRFAFKR